MPKRIKRERTRGWTLAGATTNPFGAVIVDRSSRYGNPFVIVDGLVVQAPDCGAVWSCGSEPAARRCAADLYDRWLDGAGPDTYRVNGRTYDRRRVLTDLTWGLCRRDLACTCPLPEPGQPDHCHGQPLLRRANPNPA